MARTPKPKSEAKATAKTKTAPKAKTAAAKTAGADPAPEKTASDATPTLPILYRRPVAVSAKQFANRSFVREPDFDFARHASALSVNVTQFADASASFPIVFTAEDSVMAVAVLGLRAGENLFVEADGRWAEGQAIPDYVRRYPFILQRLGNDQGFMLCVDEASSMVVEGDTQPFFKDGRRSEMTEQILQSCVAYQRQADATRVFAAALAENGLLVPHDEIEIRPGGAKIKLDGFQMVDRSKLDTLPDSTILEWRRNGFLEFLYLHLASLRTWPRLIRRFARRRQDEAGDGPENGKF